MFSTNNPHQFFEIYNDDDVLISRTTLDKIKRKNETVWIMGPIFLNPDCNDKSGLYDLMDTVKYLSEVSNYKVWPLDPLAISYFQTHSEYYKIWADKPEK